jgi:hypothetical protein
MRGESPLLKPPAVLLEGSRKEDSMYVEDGGILNSRT